MLPRSSRFGADRVYDGAYTAYKAHRVGLGLRVWRGVAN